MSLLYSLCSSALALLLLPLLLLFASRKKHRRRMGLRLGWGLTGQLAQFSASAAPTFWVHALSVGEVTSALPLVRGLRQAFPRARIVFSATTSAGGAVARSLLSPHVDALIAAPLDLGPVVPFFLRTIRPDLFLLVETDFWPHWLHCLARQNIPTFLVNGRISARSFTRYQRYACFFRPMFRSLTLMSMQTDADAAKMVALGIEPKKVVALGNLKFDTSQVIGRQKDYETIAIHKERYGFAVAPPLWICGSTHRGEEETIFRVYRRLREDSADLQLLLAPRNIERAGEIVALAGRHHLACRRWSTDRDSRGPLLILDTIGELAGCYAMADAVFVGGSLVPEGGHNPIDPAATAVPVVFGPHMEDFAEIAEELIRCGGAGRVDSEDSLHAILRHILTEPTLRRAMAEAAQAYVQANRGVVRRHLEAIDSLLAGKSAAGNTPWTG